MKHTLIGRNERFLIAVEKAGQAAKSDYPVLIVGETGVGKNALAEYIHRESDRRDRPFIHINCASIPENLMESELFGHEKGAFTGASKRKKGKIELADGGTLFLDEISCLSPLAQAKLLTFLDEYQFTRVGGLENISVDVRVVCAGCITRFLRLANCLHMWYGVRERISHQATCGGKQNGNCSGYLPGGV